MGAIGHPGDIERLRMAAIELASTEGFTRSAADVSLRRLAYYSLSPMLKTAFEQIYGPPYLARLIFAEIGDEPEEDLFLRVEYDGAIATNGAGPATIRHNFAVLSATKGSAQFMESFLEKDYHATSDLDEAINTALNAWAVGDLTGGEDKQTPDAATIHAHRQDRLGQSGVEAAILERDSQSAIRYRTLSKEELEPLATR